MRLASSDRPVEIQGPKMRTNSCQRMQIDTTHVQALR